MEKPVKSAFEKIINPIVAAGFMFEETRTHHGRGGERDKERDDDRDTKNHRKLSEEASNNARHQENGNENSNQGSAHGEHGETNLAGTLHGGGKRLHAVLDMAGDVFDDDDGVVDDEASADG